MRPLTRSRLTGPASCRGSVLIVALLFSLGIAIALGSFLEIATGASRLSYRTYHLGVAMNIAETGLEQAMWEMNRASGTGWLNWDTPSGSTSARRRTFDMGSVEGGATAVVKVYAQEKVGSTAAYIVARAIVTPPKGPAIEKWVKVTLSKRSALNIGGLGKDGIVSSGNQVVMGSFNSDPDNDPSTPPVAFSDSVMNDNMSLATIKVDATLNSGNADINGTAAVGAETTDAIEVGAQGYIGPFGTAAGTKDPNSISANFSADIPVESAPSGTYTSLGTIATATTLPRPGDTPNADGVYYYSATAINLNGEALVISPGYEVVMNIPKTSGDTISLSGNGGAIQVGSTLVTNTSTGDQTYTSSKLKIYTDGDINISGQGAATNVITSQLYTPAVTTPTTTVTTTTISNIQSVYGKGQQKNTVIGWSYTQSVTNATTTGGTTTSNTSSSTYQILISAGGTQPVASTTSTTTTSSSTTPATTTDTGTVVGQAINLQIYGTRSDADAKTDDDDTSNDIAQTFKISGNGSFSGVIYAPNADIEAKGGGNSGFIYGSLIGKSLKFTGNDCFYYDESLGNADVGSRLGIDDWDEMVTYVDRDDYRDKMEF